MYSQYFDDQCAGSRSFAGCNKRIAVSSTLELQLRPKFLNLFAAAALTTLENIHTSIVHLKATDSRQYPAAVYLLFTISIYAVTWVHMFQVARVCCIHHLNDTAKYRYIYCDWLLEHGRI